MQIEALVDGMDIAKKTKSVHKIYDWKLNFHVHIFLEGAGVAGKRSHSTINCGLKLYISLRALIYT